MLSELNKARSRRGVGTVQMDQTMLEFARKHTVWMCEHRKLQHSYGPYAENIAWGQETAFEVMVDWLTSPGHRRNMLMRDATKVGLAAYRAKSGRCYWTLVIK